MKYGSGFDHFGFSAFPAPYHPPELPEPVLALLLAGIPSHASARSAPS